MAERLKVKAGLRLHLFRRIMIGAFAVACVMLPLAHLSGDSTYADPLWTIGIMATIFFILGFCVVPYYTAALSYVLGGAGTVSVALKKLRSITRSEQSVVKLRRTLIIAVFVAWGLSIVVVVGSCVFSIELGSIDPEALSVPLFFGFVPVVILIHVVYFFNASTCVNASSLRCSYRSSRRE